MLASWKDLATVSVSNHQGPYLALIKLNDKSVAFRAHLHMMLCRRSDELPCYSASLQQRF